MGHRKLVLALLLGVGVLIGYGSALSSSLGGHCHREANHSSP